VTLAFLALQWLAQRSSSDAALGSEGTGARAKGIIELAGAWIEAYGRGGGIRIAAQY